MRPNLNEFYILGYNLTLRQQIVSYTHVSRGSRRLTNNHAIAASDKRLIKYAARVLTANSILSQASSYFWLHVLTAIPHRLYQHRHHHNCHTSNDIVQQKGNVGKEIAVQNDQLTGNGRNEDGGRFDKLDIEGC